jgi:hypothetical protein
MFVPDRLKTNAYRVLRLSADATLSEIHKAAGSMRRAVSLGVAHTTEADMPLLGQVSRTEPDIRAAIGRLENPTQRLSDRLFWFHVPRSSEPGGAVWHHDESLRGLFAAFVAGFDDVGIPVWIGALRAWHQVVSDDDYWGHVVELEQQGAFEPTAFPSEIDALRDEAVGLAAEPLVVAGRDALARDDTSTVRRILAALEELADTGPWAAISQHDIASPAVERFRASCRAVHEELGSKIVREQDAGDRNKSVCDAELKRFRAEIEPELHKVIQLLPPNHQAAQESREEAALCLTGVATDYTWADDFIASEKLHEEALTLAQNTLGTIRIEHGLEQIRGAARRQRVFGTSISSAPALGTINGFGCTLYGSSDHDKETQSYATTHYFVALFVPIFPLGRYRVINVQGNTYRFLGKLPLRTADRWHLAIAAMAILAMILIGVFSSDTSSVSSAPSRSGYAPSSQSSQVSALKARIDSGRSRMAELKTQLQPVIDEITSLNAQMETLKAELKSLDEQQKSGLQIDIDDYNAKVKTHNGLLAKHRGLIAANSTDLKSYDDLVDQDSVLVKQYNALLK